MKRILCASLVLGILMPAVMQGQGHDPSQGVWKTQCGTPTGQEKFPLADYRELPQTTVPSETEWREKNKYI